MRHIQNMPCFEVRYNRGTKGLCCRNLYDFLCNEPATFHVNVSVMMQDDTSGEVMFTGTFSRNKKIQGGGGYVIISRCE